jgi:hypothetical protein
LSRENNSRSRSVGQVSKRKLNGNKKARQMQRQCTTHSVTGTAYEAQLSIRVPVRYRQTVPDNEAPAACRAPTTDGEHLRTDQLQRQQGSERGEFQRERGSGDVPGADDGRRTPRPGQTSTTRWLTDRVTLRRRPDSVVEEREPDGKSNR